jgi:hypothetical protein
MRTEVTQIAIAGGPPKAVFASWLCLLIMGAGTVLLRPVPLPGQEAPGFRTPAVRGDFGSIPRKFEQYDVILGPDKDEADWWAGAPSVARDAKGVFWLACRMMWRNPTALTKSAFSVSPADRRGQADSKHRT